MGIPGIEATRVPEKLVQLRDLGASIVTADTPEELAAAMEAQFGVPAANVADTLRTYNATTDPIDELDPPRRRDHAPIAEAPLRAVACVAGITYTMGGLQVDEDMRVAADGLDGVFAAGADAGNVFEDVYGGGSGGPPCPAASRAAPRSRTRRPRTSRSPTAADAQVPQGRAARTTGK